MKLNKMYQLQVRTTYRLAQWLERHVNVTYTVLGILLVISLLHIYMHA